MTFEDFCRQNNIFITYFNFPTKIKGVTVKHNDYFVIGINPKLSSTSQKRTLEHEVIHILENHFQCNDVEKCEKEVRSLLEDYVFRF